MLTIAIPTYNRNLLLRKQIEKLVPQLESYVRILIIDNCSDQAVYESIRDLVNNKITVIRNAVNIGADANICRCFEYCDTEWLWVLSDDDPVKEDAVSTVLNEILKYRDYVFLNFNADSAYCTEGFSEFCLSKPNYSNIFFISVCIYNNYKLRPYLTYYYNYMSSMHGQLVLLLKYLEHNSNGKCRFFTNDILASKGHAQWSKRLFIERVPLFITAFDIKHVKMIKFAFGNSIGWHLLYFINISRIYDELPMAMQVSMIAEVVKLVGIRAIFAKNTFKQIVLNVVSFFSKQIAHQIIVKLNMVNYQVNDVNSD